MKKFISMILAMLMFLSNSYVALANENTELYVYTQVADEFDEYAISVFGDHIYCYYNRIDLPLELGNGIYVYGDTIVPTVVYPVWNNNNIVGTFKVSYSNETFSASYSEGGASELNSAKNYSTYENPLRLIKYEDKVLYALGDTVYNMESRNTATKLNINLESFETDLVVNVHNSLEFSYPTLSRAPSSWNLYWNVPAHNPSSIYYCYAYCLSPMLTCLGYSGYTFNSICLDFRNPNLPNVNRPEISFYEISPYLSGENIEHVASQTNTAYLGSSMVIDLIYNKRIYVLMGLTRTDIVNSDRPVNHFAVIHGYTYSSGRYLYKLYDPQDGSVNGLCTMDSNTREYENDDYSEYKWDAGYVYIYKP